MALPHDAQILEPRSQEDSDGGHGYFPGGVYVYEKRFTPPEEWEGKMVPVEFEGVYRNCTVSVIFYSIGNEVAEPLEAKGIETSKAQIELIHSMDSTRPVTCGLILGRAAKGQGLYQDGEMDKTAQKVTGQQSSGSSQSFNTPQV